MALLAFRVRAVAAGAGWPVGRLGLRTAALIGGFVILVSVPLGVGTYHIFQQVRVIAQARNPVEDWAEQRSWQVTDLSFDNGVLLVTATGPPPGPEPGALRQALDQAGLGDVTTRLSLINGGVRDLPAPPG